jgi:hypothetical protein
MKHKADKIPLAISDYVTAHFKEDFLFEVKDIKEVNGHTFYTIEVAKDNFIHLLTFDEQGKLASEQASQAYPADMHDDPDVEDASA